MFRFWSDNKGNLGKTLILILLGLFLNGCAVYFAVEFDTCKKCTKIKESITVGEYYQEDSAGVYNFYGEGY